MHPEQVLDSLRQLWRRFKGDWIETVPNDIALCEYDCRKDQCLYDEWATCERRTSKAAGELMPFPKTDPPPPKE